MVIAVFSYSLPAEASIFSFIERLFGSFSKNNQRIILNSQKMALLEGVYNPDIEAGKGGGDITIVNSSALLPDSGPLGTIADIEEQEANQGQISIYVVRPGDSLSEIAEMFSVSVNTIIWANDIKRGDLIRVDQTLIILPISGVQYTIKKGDTLAGIAKKFKGDAEEIIQFNGLNGSGKLAVGEIVVIPGGESSMPKYTPSYSRTRVQGAGGPSYAGYYMRPISGGRKSQGLHGYNAVDLATSCGTPIMASASGDVIINKNWGWNAGYGKYIVIKHPNGTQTLYSHNINNIVSVGWHVVKGQIIGYVGSTGRSTGCHVHFEIRGAYNPF